MQTYSSYNMLLGLAVALLSSFLIGGSVILKKKALIRLASNGHTRAGEQRQILTFDPRLLGALGDLAPLKQQMWFQTDELYYFILKRQ